MALDKSQYIYMDCPPKKVPVIERWPLLYFNSAVLIMKLFLKLEPGLING